MTTVTLEKRILKLESEVRSLCSAMLRPPKQLSTLPVGKKLLSMIKTAERDIVEGRVRRGNLRELAK